MIIGGTMGATRTLIDIAWSHSPGRVASAAPWLPSSKYRALLAYQSSFLGPGRQFPCWWMRTPLPGNLGDLLSPIIIKHLFNLVPVFCPKRSFLGVGSIIHKSRKRTIVWGSGLIADNAVDHPSARYLAVRGPLTRDSLLKRGRRVPEVYGDPAILMPLIYQPNVSIEYELGLLPHCIHLPRIRELPAGIKLINVVAGSVNDVFARIDDIARCEIIASSSLHGLILALAYGRKVIWLRDGGAQLAGDTFKFEDFFASIGVSIEPREWAPECPVPANFRAYAISASIPSKLVDGLISSFPAHMASHTS